MDIFNQAKKASCFISGLVVLIFVLNLSAVMAQGLPDAATPGGVGPERRGVEVPAPKELPEIYIPPVIDRPLGVDEGVRIVVKAFTFIGVEDIPEKGIFVADVMELVKLEKELPATYTIGQLQMLADKVTKYYREKGFILARAFLPEQTVNGGVVTIQLLIGKLGQVMSEDNEKFSDELLRRSFRHLLNKPVEKKEIESAMLYLMDYPGLDVNGIFSKGDEVGETKLTLKVQNEDMFDFSLSADNFGSEFSGEYRLRLDSGWNNPTGMGDRLGLTVLQSIDPAETTYGAFDYKVPMPNHRYALGLAGSYSGYGIGEEFESLGIDGDIFKGNVYLQRTFIKQRNLGLSTKLDFSRKHSESKQNNAQLNTEDSLSVLSGTINLDFIDYVFEKIHLGGGINVAELTYSHGFGDFLGSMEASNDKDSSRLGGSGEFAGGEFDKIYASFSRLQHIGKGLSCLLRFEGQWSEDLLVSMEQFSLSGPDRVRAYSPAELMRDKAYFASAEFILNSLGFYDKVAFMNYSWAEILQFSLFFDYAKGDLNDPLGSKVDEEDELYGAGVGMRFSLPGRFFVNLTAAKPLGDYESSKGDDDILIYFSSTLFF